jgi:hypothetical protein
MLYAGLDLSRKRFDFRVLGRLSRTRTSRRARTPPRTRRDRRIGRAREPRTRPAREGDLTSEIALGGGRITPGVVRVGDTVRRPARANTPFVRILLAELAEHGFDAAPRYLGRDEQGRETFAYLEGDVPDDLDPASATRH